MRCKIKLQITSCFLTVILLFTSCGKSGGNSSPAPNIPQSMLSAPQLDYEVPDYGPGVLVNRRGYPVEADKVAVLKGKKLPEQFNLVNVDTNETVYTGDVEKRGAAGSIDGYYGYADFSEFSLAGNYYIECDILGQSYAFEIRDKMYESIFDEVLQTVKSETDRMTSQPDELSEKEFLVCMEQMIILLLSYELYPQAHGSSEGGQIPQILEIMAQLVRHMSLRQDIKSGSTGGNEYAYAAAFAKFSYLYQSYDSRYATEILNLADKAWRFAQKEEAAGDTLDSMKRSDAQFGLLAAAELYRATGQYKYRSIILDYGKTHYDENIVTGSVSDPDGQNTEAGKETLSRGEGLAQVTYLSTRQKVDVDLCGRFMKEMMLEAEEIAKGASGNDVTLKDIHTEDEIDMLVWDMVILSVVEYVITNHEYGQIIENRHHYFNGRNLDAFRYWNTEADKDENRVLLNDNPIWTAGYLLMLSEMLANG